MSVNVYEVWQIDSSKIIKENDKYFNKNVVLLKNEWNDYILNKIDNCQLFIQNNIQSNKVISNKTNEVYDTIYLSTGCKTLLNILYNPDNIYSLKECGDNAFWLAFFLPYGNIIMEPRQAIEYYGDIVDINYNNHNFKSYDDFIKERCYYVKNR